MAKVKGSVAVVTGASSGIGRATAREFAKQGADVVLVARRSESLDELAAECESHGVRALAVPADLAEEDAAERVVRAATDRFGHIDVWVNDHAVSLFGALDETPMEDFRRVMEVNFFGQVYGAKAALAAFEGRGSGTLVNVSSVVAKLPQPYTSAYGASKAAIRSFSSSIRQEVMLAGHEDIHVCTVMPAVIDTPIFQHAANLTGREIRAFPPVYPPEKVAKAIVGLVEHPKREVTVGGSGLLIGLQAILAPGAAEKQMAKITDTRHLGEPGVPETRGNIHEPMPEWDGASGGWRSPNGTGKRVAMVATVAVPAALIWRRRRVHA